MSEHDLTLRLQKMERQVKTLRWCLAALLLTAIGVAGIAASSQGVVDEVRTKKLTVVNEQGDNSIVLMSEKNGGVLTLYSSDGRSPYFLAGARPEGAELLLKAEGGKNAVQITSSKNGGEVMVSANGQMHALGK
jgi:hypothetical protein